MMVNALRHSCVMFPSCNRKHFRGSHGGETSNGPGRAGFMRRVSELQPGSPCRDTYGGDAERQVLNRILLVLSEIGRHGGPFMNN